MLAVGLTYGIAAYLILPRVIRMGLKVLQRKLVPSFTVTGDGLPGDPVNLALIGTLAQLRAAFATLGWLEADRLSLASSWGMVRAFVLNSPYPTAPFSTLYLFGRGQDIGFQKAIDNSPRKRHHIRFWALGARACPGHMGSRRLLAEHRSATGRCARDLGRCRHTGYRTVADQTLVPDHPCHRFRCECGAGLYRCRADEKPSSSWTSPQFNPASVCPPNASTIT